MVGFKTETRSGTLDRSKSNTYRCKPQKSVYQISMGYDTYCKPLSVWMPLPLEASDMKRRPHLSASLLHIVPLAPTPDAIGHLLFDLCRVAARDVCPDVGPRPLQQHAADAQPKGRPLGNEEAASADPQQEHDDGGDLQPGHALGVFGTM